MADLQQRLAAIAVGLGCEIPNESFRILAADQTERGIDLANPQDQAAIEALLDGIDLVILDNLSTLFPNGSESAGDAWGPVQNWLLRLRRRGVSVLFVHHAGNNTGRQRRFYLGGKMPSTQSYRFGGRRTIPPNRGPASKFISKKSGNGPRGSGRRSKPRPRRLYRTMAGPESGGLIGTLVHLCCSRHRPCSRREIRCGKWRPPWISADRRPGGYDKRPFRRGYLRSRPTRTKPDPTPGMGPACRG